MSVSFQDLLNAYGPGILYADPGDTWGVYVLQDQQGNLIRPGPINGRCGATREVCDTCHNLNPPLDTAPIEFDPACRICQDYFVQWQVLPIRIDDPTHFFTRYWVRGRRCTRCDAERRKVLDRQHEKRVKTSNFKAAFKEQYGSKSTDKTGQQSSTQGAGSQSSTQGAGQQSSAQGAGYTQSNYNALTNAVKTTMTRERKRAEIQKSLTALHPNIKFTASKLPVPTQSRSSSPTTSAPRGRPTNLEIPGLTVGHKSSSSSLTASPRSDTFSKASTASHSPASSISSTKKSKIPQPVKTSASRPASSASSASQSLVHGAPPSVKGKEKATGPSKLASSRPASSASAHTQAPHSTTSSRAATPVQSEKAKGKLPATKPKAEKATKTLPLLPGKRK